MEKIIIYETQEKIGWSNNAFRQTQTNELKDRILRFLMIDVYDETIEWLVDLWDEELWETLLYMLNTNELTSHTN